MVSNIPAFESQSKCDSEAMHELFIENKYYFIKKYNGFDPQLCPSAMSNNNEKCSLERLTEIYYQSCNASPDLTDFSLQSRCRVVNNLKECLEANSGCPFMDVSRALIYYSKYFQDTLKLDPIVCKSNLITLDKVKFFN